MSSRLKLAGIVLLGSFALAACGGGGGGPTTADRTQETERPDPAIAQRASIATAISTAQAAVAAVTDEATDQQVADADAAIVAANAAILAAANVPEQERAANSGTVAALASQLAGAKERRETAMNAADEAGQKERTALAKALTKAITAGAGVAATPTSIPVIGTGDDATADITLEKSDGPAPALGGWKRADYEDSTGTGDNKITAATRVYSNADAAKSYRFDTEAGERIHSLVRAGDDTSPAGDYTLPAAGYTTVGGFPGTGTASYDEEDEVTGTFMGAGGTYTCTADAGCTAAAAGASGVTLSAGWTFTPAPGAMLQQQDGSYLQFGWWIRKNKDGPTHAGTFYGSGGTTALTAVTTSRIDDSGGALVGKATYTGYAAGKFAISDPLRPANDNAGHFTANAELNADFKTSGSTLGGTIDGFRLNDGSEDPGWSVELQKTGFDATDSKFMTTDTRDADQTVWSTSTGKGAAAGSWEAQMYDEKPNDGSNVPTSVVGSFRSDIGTTHSMVGAFGASHKKE